MKAQKIFTLDLPVIAELKKVANQSGLINNILIEYFNQHGELKKEELINKLQSKEKEQTNLIEEINVIKERIHELEVYESRVKEVFKNIPSEIISDFKSFTKMDKSILATRFRDIYSKVYDITYKEVETAFDEFHQLK